MHDDLHSPELAARFNGPHLFQVDVIYPDGRWTRFQRVPMWFWAKLWFMALCRGEGRGRVIQALKDHASVLKPTTLRRPTPARRRRVQAIRDDDGGLGGKLLGERRKVAP